MKKFSKVSVLFILTLSLVLSGCAAKAKEEFKDTAATTTETTATTETTETTEAAATTETTAAAPEVTVPTGHTSDTIKIGFVDVTGTGLISDTLGIARDQKFLEEEFAKYGVKVELVPMTGAGPAINEALASGALDVGFLGDVPGIIGKAAGIDTQIISFSGITNGASLVIPKDSTATSVSDLKGKKIATQKGAFMHKSLIDILTANSLTINDIEFINVNAQGAAEALVSGNVDGAVVGGSTLTKLVEDGYGKVLVDFREHPEWNAGGFGIAGTKFIEENPDSIYALVRALVRAKQYAIENKDALLVQWQTTGNSASSYEYLYPNHDNYYDVSSSDKSLKSANGVVDFLIKNDIITEKVDVTAWTNSTFYDAAIKDLVK